MSHKRQERKFKPILTITEGDMKYAIRHDRYNCGIVRAIQRQFPDANRVRADKELISFSLEDDRRYFFDTPPELVDDIIEPFDKKGPTAVPANYSFQLSGGYSQPVAHADSEERKAKKFRQRASSSGQEKRSREKMSHNCATYRFREE